MNTNVEERKKDCGNCDCRQANPTGERQAKIDDILSNQEEDKCRQNCCCDADILQEIYTTVRLGMIASDILAPITSDKGFRNLLLKQHREYNALAKDIELYCSDRKIKIVDNTFMPKAMMQMSATFSTAMDKSNAKLSQIMLKGVNNGILKVTAMQNRLSDIGETCEYADRAMCLLRQDYEDYKLFLQ